MLQYQSNMSTIIAFANQKGGVGKTTTAVNLGACLAQKGKKVLLVDSDPQGNATSGLGIERQELSHCLYDLLIDGGEPDTFICRSGIMNLDLIPSTIKLAGAEVELVSLIGREYRLKEGLKRIVTQYSFILIDCPPSLGLLTLNALSFAVKVLIPIQCEYYALEGLGQLLNTFHAVRNFLNAQLDVFGVVLTMYDSRTNLSQQVAGEVRKVFGEKVFATIVPRNVRLSEAPSFGKPVVLYDQSSAGAQAYQSLSQEVLERDEQEKSW